jgi:methylmalonyl-CoA/ethylmalonyl-CoA epimerase
MVDIARVVVAVRSMEDALAFYRDALGLTVTYEKYMTDNELRIVRLAIGEMEIELLEQTADTGPVARFIDENGEGLHHLVLRTDDIEHDLRTLLARQIELIDREPRSGPDGKVAFISPRSTGGVLVELSHTGDADTHTIKPPEAPS